MEDHQKLKKIVVACLEITPVQTARELYLEVKQINPTIVRKYEFKSFVKIINFLPEIKEIHAYPQKYTLKKETFI